MNKKQQLFNAAKANPRNVRFQDLEKLAIYVGFRFSREKGSHKLYKRLDDPRHTMNFQRAKKKSMAKEYQVKNLISFIEDHNLLHMLKE